MGDTGSAAIFFAIVLIIIVYFYMCYQGGESNAKVKSVEKGRQNCKNTKIKESGNSNISERKFKDLCGDESRKIIDFNQYANRDTGISKEL
jgi:predicted membrane protein